MATSSSQLIDLLDRYVIKQSDDNIDDQFISFVSIAANAESDPHVFSEIGEAVWNRYFNVNIDLMILILRRWLVTDPSSSDAKATLGSYLLMHGPDWDDEANALLEEVQRLRNE